MKLLNKVRAIFQVRSQNAELEVAEAIIKPGKVLLRPADNPKRIVKVKADTVDIVINRNRDTKEEDIEIIDKEDPAAEDTLQMSPAPSEEDTMEGSQNPEEQTFPEIPDTPSIEESPDGEDFAGNPVMGEPKPLSYFIPKKKIVSFSLYPDEYEMLMENIHSNGYKKSEFLLACVTSAKKNSLEANYHRYAVSHKERRAAERQAAYLAQQQDYLSQQEQANEPS